MKLKMLTRMAAMVAAGSLVVGLLAGCSVIPSKDGAADSAVATDTALILTQGDGMPALTNAEEFLNSVIVTPGGSAGLVVPMASRLRSVLSALTRSKATTSNKPERTRRHATSWSRRSRALQPPPLRPT